MAPSPLRLELVVARHREDLAWLRKVPPAITRTVYDKSNGAAPAVLAACPLPNVGREAHTYLHHLAARYESLADVTVFCQGRPFDHCSDFHRFLRGLAAGQEQVEDFRWLGFILDFDDARGRRLFVPWSKNAGRRELAVDEFHERLFGCPAPEVLRFFPGAQFAVAGRAVRRRPRDFYRKAAALAAEFPDAAHCFERLWPRVFDCKGIPEALRASQGTVYLKPIRRLMEG